MNTTYLLDEDYKGDIRHHSFAGSGWVTKLTNTHNKDPELFTVFLREDSEHTISMNINVFRTAVNQGYDAFRERFKMVLIMLNEKIPFEIIYGKNNFMLGYTPDIHFYEIYIHLLYSLDENYKGMIVDEPGVNTRHILPNYQSICEQRYSRAILPLSIN